MHQFIFGTLFMLVIIGTVYGLLPGKETKARQQRAEDREATLQANCQLHTAPAVCSCVFMDI